MTDSPTLFPQLMPPPERAERQHAAGPMAQVALEQGIDHVLDYAVPPRMVDELQIGQRVRVPLGRKNRAKFGFVVGLGGESPNPTGKNITIKHILGIADERVLVTPVLMELARWMSRYYSAPLGIVLDSIIPAAVKKRIGIGYNNMVRLAKPRGEIQEILEKTKAPKRRAILARLLQLESDQAIELTRLAEEAGVRAATARKLVALGIVTIRSEADLPRLDEDLPHGSADEKQIELNEDQKIVFDELKSRLNENQFSVNLLHGVTGSGKTEIYLQLIAQTVARGKKALVLVPEIALTPQTVQRFRARFNRVAILHSGLSATQRHKFWHQISQGRADVVVGARSAVFAPLPDVGIIVVDEEHESSYKQDQVPRYHGRDVAIKRAQIENVPIILGSATPSLETYWRCKNNPSGRHHYLELPRRVRGLALPTVELVDMRQERTMRRGIHLISVRLEHLLRTTLAAGKQAIILLNRRGYSNFVYCASCDEPIKCKFCDTTMTYHRSADAHAAGGSTAEGLHTGQLHCHYCLAVNKLPAICPVCGKKLSLFGLGTQRVEEELAKKFPDVKFARVDSDSMRSARDYESTLNRFGSGELQVMLGTQMIAKGLDYPNVTLVGVISGDTALALPDFRAAERTFQLITQVSGRAGRGDSPGRVILQTFMPDDPTIRAAVKQDFAGFAATELAHRRENNLPPFWRMARLVIRHRDGDALLKISQELAEKIVAAMAPFADTIKMRGPMPCPINRIGGYHRQQIDLRSPTAEPLQKVLAAVRAEGALAKAETIAVDVDPVSLL
ncbi:MAG: primosomal protein N' [Tepidisphaeraceae bacterium]